jgi:hypothetical protein
MSVGNTSMPFDILRFQARFANLKRLDVSLENTGVFFGTREMVQLAALVPQLVYFRLADPALDGFSHQALASWSKLPYLRKFEANYSSSIDNIVQMVVAVCAKDVAFPSLNEIKLKGPLLPTFDLRKRDRAFAVNQRRYFPLSIVCHYKRIASDEVVERRLKIL